MGMDLIAEVMSAVEPARLDRARTRLSALAGAQPTENFPSTLRHVAGSAETQVAPVKDLIMEVMANADRNRMADATLKLAGLAEGDSQSRAIARERVIRQFESTLLASTLESILPKSQDALTGGGTAAEMWRGQQIQFTAEALAERSPLGLIGMFADSQPEMVRLPGADSTTRSGPIRPFAYRGEEVKSS
jgi:hypothetical protein